MSDCMHFPDTVEEFMEQYKMTDAKQVYSNGTEYVPIFRMEQWFEHEKTQLSKESTTSDLISRQAVIDALAEQMPTPYTPDGSHLADEQIFQVQEVYVDCITTIKLLPTIQPQSTTGQLNDGVRSTARSTELIDRQAAIDALDCISGVEEVLRSLPTIQPEPTDEQVAEYCKRRCLHIVTDDFFHTAQPEPKEGHWIRRDCGLDVECKCSKCGYRDFVEPRDEYWFKRNYYPNCGAKMKGVYVGEKNEWIKKRY